MRTGIAADLGTNSPADRSPRNGLSSAQAASQLAADGPNVLPTPRPVPLWRRVVAQLRDPLVLVLLAAAVLTTATGDWTDAGVIMLVVVVNTTAGVIQEIKADRAISALSQLAAPEARVVRDGGQRQIPAAEVVPGDLLVLAEGDIVPADARVIEGAALLVDESALTGESVPADKSPAPVPAWCTLANPMLLAAVAIALALQFAGLYLPFLQDLLHTEPLTGLDLFVVFLLSTLGYAAIRLDRLLFRRRRASGPAGNPELSSRDDG